MREASFSGIDEEDILKNEFDTNNSNKASYIKIDELNPNWKSKSEIALW